LDVGDLETFRVIATGVIYVKTHWIESKCIGEVALDCGPQARWVTDIGIQPERVALGIDDYGHPAVQLAENPVGLGGENRAALDHPTGGISPALPESGESEHSPAFEPDVMGLLGRSGAGPLVEPIPRNEAASVSKGIPECRFL